MNRTDRDDELERLVGRALRDLPPRRAPHSLEARVFAEIQQRAAAPWWRKSFMHWPPVARTAFLAASIGSVYVGVRMAMWLFTSFESTKSVFELPPEVTWVHTMLAALVAVVRDVPSLWVYGALAALAALYAAMFGIGATAYRTLYAR